jgi:hypothetical protein
MTVRRWRDGDGASPRKSDDMGAEERRRGQADGVGVFYQGRGSFYRGVGAVKKGNGRC